MQNQKERENAVLQHTVIERSMIAKGKFWMKPEREENERNG